MTAAARIWIVILAAASGLRAQPAAPRTSPSDYPARAVLGQSVTLAAEYLVHAIPTPEGSFFTNDYLVVEAMFFGPRLNPLKLAAENFALRINGRKIPLTPDAPGAVAASLKYPDWTRRPAAIGTAGIGDRQVIIGQPAPVERFPGDPRARRGPAQPRAPEPENPAGQPQEARMPVEERIQRAALPSGEQAPPAGGLLFFRFEGKTRSIKSVQLEYDGPAGKVTLKLL